MSNETTIAAGEPPLSVTNGWICAGGMASLIAGLVIMVWVGVDALWATAIAMALMTVPMALGDIVVLKVHRRTSSGLKSPGETPNPFDGKRIAVKLFGLTGVLVAIAAFYWAMPIYRYDFYAPFFVLVSWVLPVLLMLTVPYVVWLDSRMGEPHDGTWQAGQVFLGRWRGRDLGELKTFLLGWVIKAFFLPLMVGILYNVVVWMLARPIGGGFANIFDTIIWIVQLALFADVAIASVGYVVTLRLLDSHIRSVNPLVIGWLVALICYQPFWSLLTQQYLDFNDGFGWWDWLEGNGVLVYAWGGLLVLANLLWVWANMTFGLRFSNLTHRGILTNGPYRWTKHPSYISKNIYWWLLSVPFISLDGWEDALRNCLLLLLVNGIYLARARTEERHLSEDPTYIAYARWVEAHGVFRWVGRAVPVLAYRAPSTAAPAAGPAR